MPFYFMYLISLCRYFSNLNSERSLTKSILILKLTKNSYSEEQTIHKCFECLNAQMYIYSDTMVLMIYQYFYIDAIVVIYRYNEFSIAKYLYTIIGRCLNNFLNLNTFDIDRCLLN